MGAWKPQDIIVYSTYAYPYLGKFGRERVFLRSANSWIVAVVLHQLTNEEIVKATHNTNLNFVLRMWNQ